MFFIAKANDGWRKIRDTTPTFPLHMTPERDKLYQEATHQQICKKCLSSPPRLELNHAHRKEIDDLIAALRPLCNLMCVNKRREIRLFSHNLAYVCVLLSRYLTETFYNEEH